MEDWIEGNKKTRDCGILGAFISAVWLGLRRRRDRFKVHFIGKVGKIQGIQGWSQGFWFSSLCDKMVRWIILRKNIILKFNFINFFLKGGEVLFRRKAQLMACHDKSLNFAAKKMYIWSSNSKIISEKILQFSYFKN